MNRNRNRLASLVLGTAALCFAATLASRRPASLRAGNGVRSGESISVTGPYTIQQTLDRKMQVPLDTVYWLDYGAAKLYATVPSSIKTATEIKVIRAIGERDLMADFAIKRGVDPHFLMNTASLGALAKGSSILVVIETSTRQVAAYQAIPKEDGLESAISFRMLQMLPYAKAPATPEEAASRSETVSAVGSMIIQVNPADHTQVPLDGVYWLDNRHAEGGGAMLYATMPYVRRTVGGDEYLIPPSGRDVAADFKLAPGASPRFLINTSALGASTMGASVLLVFETTTKQVAAYRVSPTATIAGARPDVALLEIKKYDHPLPALPAAE